MPCFDKQRSTRLSGAPAATPAYWDRLLVLPAFKSAAGIAALRARAAYIVDRLFRRAGFDREPALVPRNEKIPLFRGLKTNSPQNWHRPFRSGSASLRASLPIGSC
jgi:hypothetical protein